MAEKVNKSQIVRDLLDRKGIDTTYSQVESELAPKEINAAFFNVVKNGYKNKNKAGGKKKGRSPSKPAKAGRKPTPHANNGESVEITLEAAVEFVKGVGSLAKAEEQVAEAEANVTRQKALVEKFKTDVGGLCVAAS